MNRLKHSLWILLAFVAILMGDSASAQFVTVKNGKFFLGDKEYRYVGTNFWYGAILASEGRGGDRKRLKKELDLMQDNGVENVRVLVGGDGKEGLASHIEPVLQTAPGEYNDTILQGLDYLMAEFEKRNMKAILYFNNAWEWSGGYGTYLEWATGKRCPIPGVDGWPQYMEYVGDFVMNDKAIELSTNHVKNIVTRRNTVTGQLYKDSPALMAWEIANEPRCFVDDSVHKARLVAFIDRQSKLIKQLDPNHLVTTGSEGKHGCEQDINLFTTIHSLPCIDYACIHIWPYNWSWIKEKPDSVNELTMRYIDEAYERMQPFGRPVVLEEFGYPRDNMSFKPGSPTTGRDAYYKYVFSVIYDSGKIAGCNFWGWGGKAKVKHVIWQRWDDYVGDPAQEEQGLNSVFDDDKSTLKIIKNFANKLNQLSQVDNLQKL